MKTLAGPQSGAQSDMTASPSDDGSNKFRSYY